MRTENFLLPDIGEGINEVVVKSWNVKVGDTVKEFDPICEVESDKATATISSRFEGVIIKIHYQEGDNAKVGKPLVDISVTSDAEPDSTKHSLEPRSSTNADHSSNGSFGRLDTQNEPLRMLPSVRRLALQNGVDLSRVIATGSKGRIEKADILAYLEQTRRGEKCQASTAGSPEVSTPQLETTVSLASIKKAMFKAMSKSLQVPHFNYSDEIDVTHWVEWSKRQKLLTNQNSSGSRVSNLAIMIKMISLALLDYPELNASVDTTCENLIVKKYHNIGVAIDTKIGLVVPNIKGVENLSILEVDSELRRLRELAYNSKLGPADLSGGTISISNIGAIGGVFGVPVIVVPEIVIGALGKIRQLPRFDQDGKVVARQILQVVWSADHRVVDGATLSRFSNLFKGYLENPETALLKIS